MAALWGVSFWEVYSLDYFKFKVELDVISWDSYPE